MQLEILPQLRSQAAHTQKKNQFRLGHVGPTNSPTVSELMWPTWFLNASGAKPNGYVDLNFVAWACLWLAHEPYSRSKIIPFSCSNVFPFFLDGFHLLSRQKQKRKRMIHILHLCLNMVTRRCTRSIGMRWRWISRPRIWNSQLWIIQFSNHLFPREIIYKTWHHGNLLYTNLIYI